MSLMDHLKEVKNFSHQLSLLTDEQRNDVLRSLAEALRKQTRKIISSNEEDLKQTNTNHQMYDRLLLNEERIKTIADDIDRVAQFDSPVGKIIDQRTRPNGLRIHKVTVPLGVVAVIYESRPNVTLDVFALCFKSGNACVLKGGKEAHHSNSMLVSIIQDVLTQHHIDQRAVFLLPPSREETSILLHANGLVDVCIPRGSQSLIDFVRQNATIPIIETGAGIVHTYFDRVGDTEKGRQIIHNAKTRRVSVCNALDCLVVHKDRLDDLYMLVQPLADAQVEIFADDRSYDCLASHYPSPLLFRASPEDYGREFLSYKMAIKTVDSIDEAITHITQYTSGHSEAIITEEPQTAAYFTKRIDAAVVYVNASTAFTDGGEFGMGAEIGISTQKLHARGPMGIDALTSYQWIVYGDGQIR